jgi:hypothetical protein
LAIGEDQLQVAVAADTWDDLRLLHSLSHSLSHSHSLLPEVVRLTEAVAAAEGIIEAVRPVSM